MGEKRDIRTPILSVVGHIDHGKTTLLDSLRGTTVAEKEAGRVTQHIGATEVPITTIKQICEPLKRDWAGIDIPGLLIIDTPGHHAFASLRKRGSALADVAVIVVDVMEGFQPQTYESLNVLRLLKTPFVVVLNKIDRIKGWHSKKKPFLINYTEQPEYARKEVDTRIYSVVGDLYDKGLLEERGDRTGEREDRRGHCGFAARAYRVVAEVFRTNLAAASGGSGCRHDSGEEGGERAWNHDRRHLIRWQAQCG
jgi:translation initiation factor 5B